ncbi:MAG: FkbM family methyltransferase, partial [Lamprobacter sp.]|uniref:FkbM family methyltransferase n=1 Tax=Lamprobacter sp. TaxID=3100796 RepID=UPI002B25FFBE
PCLRLPLARPSLLKIDVQGFELEVLKGATGLLPEIDVVYVEASDVELYPMTLSRENCKKRMRERLTLYLSVTTKKS